MKFYIIPENIAIEFQGFQKENKALHFTKTNQGVWVMNVNCFEEVFTEIAWSTFEITELTHDDFIPTYEDKPLVNGYRWIGTFDNNDQTVNIHLFKDSSETIITRPYVDSTWDDPDIENYINQLD